MNINAIKAIFDNKVILHDNYLADLLERKEVAGVSKWTKEEWVTDMLEYLCFSQSSAIVQLLSDNEEYFKQYYDEGEEGDVEWYIDDLIDTDLGIGPFSDKQPKELFDYLDTKADLLISLVDIMNSPDCMSFNKFLGDISINNQEDGEMLESECYEYTYTPVTGRVATTKKGNINYWDEIEGGCEEFIVTFAEAAGIKIDEIIEYDRVKDLCEFMTKMIKDEFNVVMPIVDENY